MAIVCKSAEEIDKMRRSGRVVRQVLDSLRTMVAPGVSTMDLERAAEKQIQDAGAKAVTVIKIVLDDLAR